MTDQKDQLEYYLDQYDYDYIILGTGLNECLYSACLSKLAKKKVLVIDLDNVYSSSIRTLNLKEFNNYFTGNYKKSEQKSQIFSNILQQNVEENNQFVQKLIEDKTFRSFNLDLQPRIIFSTSPTTDLMRQADMDKYMDFRAINGIYHYDNQKSKFILAPSTKSDIFTHQDLTIMEKKQMFTLLHTCIKLYNRYTGYVVDINSTDEFDKDFQVEEKYIKIFEEHKNARCTLFINELTKSEKIKSIFLYTLCNYEFNPELPLPSFLQESFTTISFLKRLDKFMKSCGVHTQLPYLYTNYGTGDIPQGFARIAAVFGAVFCINHKIKINNLCQKEQLIQLSTNLAGEKEFVNSKGIIIGPEYLDLISQYLPGKQEEDEVVYLQRQTIIIQKEYTEQESENKKAPLVFNIPPGCKELQNEHPVWMFLTDEDTLSTPKGYAVIYLKQIISNNNEEILNQNYKNSETFVLKALEGVQGGLYKCQIVYHVSYIQELRKDKMYQELMLEDTNKVIFLEQDNFSVDLDQNFYLFKEHITYLTEIQKDQESYFMTQDELKGIVDSNMVPIDYSENDGISNILKNYEKLKQKQLNDKEIIDKKDIDQELIIDNGEKDIQNLVIEDQNN